MKKYKINLWKMHVVFLGVLITASMLSLSVHAAEKTIYSSPYVTFAPDGRAWTTNAGDRAIVHYSEEDNIDFRKMSTLSTLEPGQHYYKFDRTGDIPVKEWRVIWENGECIHNSYPKEGEDYHGISFGRQICATDHFSGWTAYCADCGEPITNCLIYMSKEAARSIEFVRVEDGLDYYYLCPFCNNLEQGCSIRHQCMAVSNNRYRVIYDANRTGEDFGGGGYMSPSIHIYNNDDAYEGRKVTPVTRLSRNTYNRIGYQFLGWNTEPDGSGIFFRDTAKIANLTTENWNGEGNSMEGTVVLYAQWELRINLLKIDPDGGKYNGKQGNTILARPYGDTYILDNSLVEAPAGFAVHFECNGGVALPPVTGTQHFVEWSMVQPFGGSFINGEYKFLSPNGNVKADTLKACYASDSITLPTPTKAGSSFGGWYYDVGFTQPAGGAGDQITPTGNMTLYAQWVELVLGSADNYAANGGKGAVDLSWSQPDGNGKTYLIYQSLDRKSWNRINTAEDIDSSRQVKKEFTYTGKAETYTVPYGGIYSLSLFGAQGGNYGSYAGGAGGSVTGRFYLYKGERLTVTVGGRDGYNGGGKASQYGTGGGMTSLVSDKKGTLLVAGGGGGATVLYDGYPGGSAAGLRPSGNAGQDGASGGGGGYRGGLSGELVYHVHSNVLCGYHDHGKDCYTAHTHSDAASCYTNYHHIVRGDAVEYDSCGCRHQNHYVKCNYPGCTRGEWSFRTNYSGDCTQGHVLYDSGLNQHSEHAHVLTCQLPETPVLWCLSPAGWQCGRTTDTIESAKPSYGGSSYVNTGYALAYCMTAGMQKGNGKCALEAVLIGFQDVPGMEGVSAPDLAAPDAVDAGLVEKVPVDALRVSVLWQEPKDNGTDYYHRAETYLQGSTTMLCSSNITKNTLATGVKGYYYLLDEKPDTRVNRGAAYTEERNITIEMKDYVQYLHLAAADGAGNVSGTTHIRLDAEAVNWNLCTRQLQIGNGTNVFAAAGAKTYYVRCDGVTPFLLEHGAYMEGTATRDYQLNYTIYNSVVQGGEGSEAQNIVYTPPAEDAEADRETKAEGLSYSVNGNTLLGQYPYSITRRFNHGRELKGEQMFLLGREANGLYLNIWPTSGIEFEKDGLQVIKYSDPAADAGNGITVIGDCEGPVIRGLDVLQGKELIDRMKESITIEITAEDALSGVADFYIKVENQDNYSEQIFYPEGGILKLEITKGEPIFTGDFTVTGYAADNVGNITEISFHVTEFALETRIERILEPHIPVFKGGESGILYITTYGYADRVEVEFPEELLALNPELNKSFDYGDMQVYQQESSLQFMIPLYAPANPDYQITVRAYKDGKLLEQAPGLGVAVEEGTVLSEFRTRLR